MNYEDKYNEILEWARKNKARLNGVPIEEVLPELAESEDERIRKRLIEYFDGFRIGNAKVKWEGLTVQDVLAWLEKQKENPKSADSISSDCMLDAKCEDRWYKVTDSFPDNGRLVLAKDCLGNVLLARYDGENWEVNVYDNEDHYCHNSISKWCEIPYEEQQESLHISEMCKENADSFTDGIIEVRSFQRGMEEGRRLEKQKEQKPKWSEEDEKYLNRVINLWVNDFGEDSDTVKWLKSLRPSWKPSEEELAKKHLDGYCMGREDTLREMKDFVESHFTHREYKSPECGTCASALNTSSGTSTLKAEG